MSFSSAINNTSIRRKRKNDINLEFEIRLRKKKNFITSRIIIRETVITITRASTEPLPDKLKMFSLVWLDSTVNDTQRTIAARQILNGSIDRLQTFRSIDECEKHIQSVPRFHQIVLIVEEQHGRVLVPRIHSCQQLSSIYVYCKNKKKQEWTREFTKVKGVTETLDELVSLILSSEKRRRNHYTLNEPFSCNIIKTSKNLGSSTTELNGQFVHSKLLIDCLIRMRTSTKDKEEFFAHRKRAYSSDESELKMIRDLEQEYTSDKALRCYTNVSFLFREINEALRAQNVDSLFLLRFCIRDLRQQLKEYQHKSRIDVYRGQMISKKEFEKLKNSVGKLISMNSFLSTTRELGVALIYLGMSAAPSDHFQRVLFEIDADPHLPDIQPFADISELSKIPDEREVLFMLGSVFRIRRVYSDKGMWIIQLDLCSDNDHDLKPILDSIKEDYNNYGETHVGLFGCVLAKMGKFHKAQTYFHRCLEEFPPDHYNRGVCYHYLGIIATEKGDYDSSLKWYNKSLQIKIRYLESSHPSIAMTHNCIASTYLTNGQYTQALEAYNNSLAIFERKFGTNHITVAECSSNIGCIYVNQKNYSEAMKCYKKALAIQQQQLPSNHRHIGETYVNIAAIHRSLGHLETALKHYEEALAIFRISLPDHHPRNALIYHGMGAVYVKKRQFQLALSNFEKAAAIWRDVLPSNHPHLNRVKQNIRDCLRKLNQ